MANINWKSGHSGSWGDANNWDTGVPTINDNVQINVPITVTIDPGTAAQAFALSTGSGSTLQIDGGTLFTADAATFNGAFVESAGTFMVSGSGAAFDGPVTFSGGIIQSLAGAPLVLNGGGSLAGTFTGTGPLDLFGGTTYIDAGFTSGLSSIVVNALVGFETNFKTAGNFTILNNGSVDLFGHTLTVTGTLTSSGILGNGTVVDSGTMKLGNPASNTVYDNGLIMNVVGTAIQNGNIYLGARDSGAKVSIAKTGTYDINGNWNIGNPSSIGSITNAGIFAKTGGGKLAQVDTNVTSTGTIAADTGTLLLNGLVNSIAGAVSGAGTLGIAGGQTTLGLKLALTVAEVEQQSGILVLNKALSYGGEWDMTGGVLNLNGKLSKLTLTGHSNFDGGTLSGYGGTILLKGQTQLANVLIGGPNTLTLSGTLDQTGSITFGESSNPVATILAGAVWSIEADSSIFGSFGVINNDGTFIDPNGSGTATVYSAFESTGTVTVNSSILQFHGLSTTLGGTITGSGLLDLAGSTLLQSGVGISVAALNIDGSTVELGGNLAYAGSLSETGNQADLNMLGHTLTVSGSQSVSLDAGNLDNGVLASGVLTTINNYDIQGGATLAVTAAAEQTGGLNLNGTLAVAAGAVYRLDDDVNIGSPDSAGVISLAGTMVVDGTINTTIGATLNQTGKLIINDRALYLQNNGALGGAISGQGSLILQGGTYTLQSGLALSTPALQLQATLALAGNENYAGYFVDNGAVNLAAHTLSLTGSTVLNNTLITGPGTLSAGGSTTLGYVNIVGGAVLNVTGTADQNAGAVTLTAATLMVASAGNYTLEVGQSITESASGGGTLAVAGTLTAAGHGGSTIALDAIVDTGKIAVGAGNLTLGGAIGGTGSFSIGSNARMAFAGSAIFTAGAPTLTVGFAGSAANLLIGDSASFNATLANFASTDVIEISGIDPGSITGTYGNTAHTQLLITDSAQHMLTLNFSTAQTLTQLTFGPAADGLASITHT